MACSADERWRTIAGRFPLPGCLLSVRPFGSGLINTTLLVETDAPARVILQRINRRVFPEPAQVQRNLRTLHDHLASARAPERLALQLPGMIPTLDGADFLIDDEGEVWRALDFIDGTQSFDAIGDEVQAVEIGRALGHFHALLADLDPDRLHDTLPGFHVTPGYLATFDRVHADFGGERPPSLRAALEFVQARREFARVLEDAKAAGALTDRVIHGDPKLNNILFDESTGVAVAMIDLDTVKPGLIHYDLGDCLRSCCNRAGEGGAESVEFDVELCREVLAGYFAEAAHFLTGSDIAYLFDAIRLLPFELGLRFLTDHMAGDRYFHVTEPGQNLRRAQIQFQLVESIERQEKTIRSVCGSG
ncbi:phosphotransferase enzyme family protein [Methylotetracoccus oryzae]|uniref:phosphotransferase enzyme family protein n=1 Tax=Methylotetracoccus oryzae TaxID=1919059 RepID=UPI00111A4EE8|nr:aminoglycoside phosphotransferase family protein [Methylotetracoccus oryzae]